jgi:tRNA pseudouridine13 synthase
MSVEIDLKLPYATAGLAGIGGALKTTPEHFVVEEIPLYEAQGSGQHLYVNLTKEGLTSRDVQKQLAKVFNLPPKEVGMAGMKDKHARTTQTFSLNVGHVDDAFVAEAPSRIEDHLPVTVNWVKRHKNKLKRGHLLGNRFTVVISELAVPVEEALQRTQAVVDAIRRRGIPNYYGPQRLGATGDNVRRGYDALQGKRVTRDRWLHRFLLACFQSYLCNRYLARRMENGYFDQILLGDVAKKYDTGGLFTVEDPDAEQVRYSQQEISFTAPIFGRKMWPASGPAGDLESQVLVEAGVTIEQLSQAGLTGSRRLGRLLIPDLEAKPVAAGLQVSFSLPKGAFATVVLRELMKVGYEELAHVTGDDDNDAA